MDLIVFQTLHFKVTSSPELPEADFEKMPLCPCCFYDLDLPYSWSLHSVCPDLVSDPQILFAAGPKKTNLFLI